MTWQFNIGLDEIDFEDQELIDLINQLFSETEKEILI